MWFGDVLVLADPQLLNFGIESRTRNAQLCRSSVWTRNSPTGSRKRGLDNFRTKEQLAIVAPASSRIRDTSSDVRAGIPVWLDEVLESLGSG